MFLLYFIYILNMCFYFSHLTCTFHFNCCLNKIFVIVIVIVNRLKIQNIKVSCICVHSPVSHRMFSTNSSYSTIILKYINNNLKKLVTISHLLCIHVHVYLFLIYCIENWGISPQSYLDHLLLLSPHVCHNFCKNRWTRKVM